ncbi:uncharacterized protein LOC119675804 [Teleopsis dalmanni]|uniref:uncharacterized protein LOC119675804 n=1 Tax=Teleopsis dalmanni TaxID=139649 RepID=UPI0018CD9C1E|nr:uncharacterized protein LOC119675804 [Teleopsis dalmanni]XP_037942949.1 uncharacterized protein LOC119675804 [Teleopsis dalmanni]
MEITSENAKFNETWCRTCNEKTNIIFLHSLEERAGSCPSLANMLLEITGINTNIDSSPKFLPKYICGNCTYKLNVAYGFMIQAKRVNKQFLANLHNSSNEEFKLEELQIDEESVKIKIETFIGDDASEIHDVVNANVNDLESCYKSDLEKSNLNLKGTVDSASNFNCKIKTELLSFEVQDETSNLNTASEILDPISVAETHWNIDKTDAEFKSMNDKECLKSETTSSAPGNGFTSVAWEDLPNENEATEAFYKQKCFELENKNKLLQNQLQEINISLQNLTNVVNKQNVMLQKLTNKIMNDDEKFIRIFPIQDLYTLQHIDEELAEDSQTNIISYIKQTIGHTELSKCVKLFFSERLLEDINWDGLKGKTPIKTIKLFNTFVFEAVKNHINCYTDFENAFRKGFRNCKLKMYKKKYREKRTELQKEAI